MPTARPDNLLDVQLDNRTRDSNTRRPNHLGIAASSNREAQPNRSGSKPIS
jgi:hypothetical protein